MKKIIVMAVCSLFLFSVPASGAKRKVHTIGDSTMSEYKVTATPKRGWGMYLQAFFNADSVEVNNRGKSASLSFSLLTTTRNAKVRTCLWRMRDYVQKERTR